MLRLALLVLWTVQLALVLLLVDASWIEAQIDVERDQLEAHFGRDQAQRLLTQARLIFDRWLIGTEIVDHSYTMVTPDPGTHKHGMENVAPWFFAWLQARLDTLWLLLLQIILRVLVLKEWLIVVAAGVLAAMLDGYIQRHIKRLENRLASADRYLLARQAALLGLVFPAIYVALPIAAPMWLAPAWGLYMSLTVRALLAHAQHQL